MPATLIPSMLSVYMTKFYIEYMNVPANLMSLAMSVALALDSILDPVIAYFSDTLNSRWGRRRPFIAFAFPIMIASFLFVVVVPPPAISSFTSFIFDHSLFATVYFMAFYSIFLLAETLYSTPYSALVFPKEKKEKKKLKQKKRHQQTNGTKQKGFELTSHHSDRNVLFMIGMAISSIAVMLAMGGPPLVASLFGIEYYAYLCWSLVCAALFAVTVVGMLVSFKAERPVPIENLKKKYTPLIPGLIRCFRNWPFCFQTVAIIINQLRPDAAILMPYYMQYVLKTTPSKRAIESQGHQALEIVLNPPPPTRLFVIIAQQTIGLLVYSISALVLAPVWTILANKIGKAKAFALASVFSCIGSISVFFSNRPFDVFFFFFAIFMGGAESSYGLTNSIVADCCDYDELTSGLRKEAQYD